MATISNLQTPLSNGNFIKILWSDEYGYQTWGDMHPVTSAVFVVNHTPEVGQKTTHTLQNGNALMFEITSVTEPVPGEKRYTVTFKIVNSDGEQLWETNTSSGAPPIGEYTPWGFYSYVQDDAVYLSFGRVDRSVVYRPIVFSPISNNAPVDMTLVKNSGTSFTLGSTELFEYVVHSNPIEEPYDPGGTSGTGGGTGNFDGTGDLIGIPSLPTLSAVDAGFITLFNPSIFQLSSLATYMWSDLFDIDGWRKIFADPMNAILGLSIVPVNVPSGGAKEVKVGNISTGVSMTVASSQYVEVDCGTLNVNEFWGAYLDYDPYTKAEIYLPYIGTHALSVDDIMNKSVHVVYHVDVLSGACCAYVQCGGTVLYTFIGQCSSSIPITGDNWTNVVNGAISIAGSIGSMVATGGASAPMAIGNIASTAVNTMKPAVEKSGAMGGTGGMMGVQTPYLILTRPRQALPEKQNTFTGYPSFITETLSNLSGYTEIFSIHLENVPATEQELSEIESLLKSGVIF